MMCKGILLAAFFLFSGHSFAATISDQFYSITVDLRGEKRPLEKKIRSTEVQPIRLFYERRKNGESTDADFISIKFEDLRLLQIVENDPPAPISEQHGSEQLACVVITDGNAILMGYLEAKGGIFKAEPDLIFKKIQTIRPFTEKKDQADSSNYFFECSKEFLWKDLREGDFVKYIVSEKKSMEVSKEESNKKEETTLREAAHKVELIQKVNKIKEEAIEIEITKGGKKAIEILSFQNYPRLKIKNILPQRKLRLKPFIIQETAEKKSLEVEAFEFEVEGEDGATYLFSFHPAHLPIGLADGLQGLLLAKAHDQRITRQIVEVSRLRSGEGLSYLDEKEKERLKGQMKDFSKGFFLKLKEKGLNPDNIDQFIAIEDLFVALDGFPQSFSGLKTIEEKIEEMEEAVDRRFDNIEAEVRSCENELIDFEERITIAQMKLEADPENKDYKREIYIYQYQKERLEERMKQLRELKLQSLEEIKHKKRKTYDESFSKEGGARRRVIFSEINAFFQSQIPSGVNLEDALAVGHFQLISPARGSIQFPHSDVKIHLRRYGEQWKIRAIVR